MTMITEQNTKDILSFLIIEDSDTFLELALEMLNEYQTMGAKTAEEGLAFFKEHRPDITFLDIGLPDQDGHQLLERLTDINPNAFIVMLTASHLREDVQTALTKGARGYIVKPFTRKQIKESIEHFQGFKESLASQHG